MHSRATVAKEAAAAQRAEWKEKKKVASAFRSITLSARFDKRPLYAARRRSRKIGFWSTRRGGEKIYNNVGREKFLPASLGDPAVRAYKSYVSVFNDEKKI